eukprot:CAMPEP_0197274696 /NCGR_PEP_ID=MMETSP1432-20130617/12982_1 /TAXON_ID=44447 /ORGANISM="Pseudo-nitzschia delicatissima, Strain UNC1205" /LENGTH=67 /DNA_ID=CAMNT_0042740511 /DNA_START=9 /DNA_END=208 /DNA_ORIENTATION=+
MMERKKLWGSLVAFATLDFGTNNNDTKAYTKSNTTGNDSRHRPPSPGASLNSGKTSETRTSNASTTS